MSWKSFVSHIVDSALNNGKQTVEAPVGSSHEVKNEVDAAVARAKALRAANGSQS